MGVPSSTLYSLFAFAALIAVTSLGCSSGDKAQATAAEHKARAIKTESGKAESIRRNVDVVGTLAAEDQVTISAEASGSVSRIFVDLGDRVVAGQVLVELDREKLQYSADEQKAT